MTTWLTVALPSEFSWILVLRGTRSLTEGAAMAALTFFAYFFLGIGPGLAFFAMFIAPKSFLVLLSFFRCEI